ncbi:hypothetical protein ACOSQ3_021876 [Xanthoceras sorbifolium]
MQLHSRGYSAGGYNSGASHTDSNWYIDSGATNHVTLDIGNLSLKSDYKGKDHLAVGNGTKLPISHIGFTVIPSHIPLHSLYLKNILHVPSITKNLLSISQFTKDNNAIVEFNSDFCVIKDRNSKKTLLQGAQKDGLYHLLMPAIESHKFHGLSSQPKSVVYFSNFQCTAPNQSSVSAKSACLSSSQYSVDAEKSAIMSQVENRIHANCNPAFTNNKTAAVYVSQSDFNASPSTVLSIFNGSPAHLWHFKLSHPSHKVLHQILHSLKITTRTPFFCDSCQCGKAHQLPFPSSFTRT